MSDKISAVATGMTYTASGSTVLSVLAGFNPYFTLSMFIIAFLTFGVNWFYKHKSYKLQQKAVEEKIKSYQAMK